MLLGQALDVIPYHRVDRNPLLRHRLLIDTLKPRDIEQLVDQPIQSINVLHHRLVKLLTLRPLDTPTIECLQIQLQRRYRRL